MGNEELEIERTILTSALPLLPGVLFLLLISCTWTDTQAILQPSKKESISAPVAAAGNGDRAAAHEIVSDWVNARVIPAPHIPHGDSRFTAKTEMMTIGDSTVRWPEFYFWLRFIEKHYRKVHRIDKISDWRTRQNGMALKTFFLSSAVGYACQERAIEAIARESGLKRSSADEAQIEQINERRRKIYGQTEYRRMIRREYVAEEVFAYLTGIDHIGKRLYTHLYGENGERCPEENDSACRELFRSQVEAQCAELDIAYTEAYHRIDLELLFK